MESLTPKKHNFHCWLFVIIMIQMMCGVLAHEGNQEQSQDVLHPTDNKQETEVCNNEKRNCGLQDAVANKDNLEDDNSKIRLVHNDLGSKEKKIEDLVDKGEGQSVIDGKSDKSEVYHSGNLEIGERDHQQNLLIGSENQNPEANDDDGETQEPIDVKHNTALSNSTSVMGEWFKYFIDLFLEEFKEVVISKHVEHGNHSNSSDINTTLSETTVMNISNITTQLDVIKNDTEIQNGTETGKKMKFECIGRNVTDNSNATVRIITSAKLLQLLTFDKNDTDNITDCIVVMFYAPWCKFCARTAPHFNALARAFPQLDFVAVDTAQFSNILARFGTVSVPNVLVFHQSRSTVKFNQTERVFPNFVSFLKNATGLEPNSSVEISEVDYIGPVPSVPTDDPDYLLLLSWVFVIFCSLCMFVKSTKGQQWITRVRVLWQEHQHID